MAELNIGDRVACIWEPNKIGTVKSINTLFYSKPVYTIQYEDGNEYANYGAVFKKIIDKDEVLRHGKVLMDDILLFENPENGYIEINDMRIRVIRYEYRLFSCTVINGEVVKFKELTI